MQFLPVALDGAKTTTCLRSGMVSFLTPAPPQPGLAIRCVAQRIQAGRHCLFGCAVRIAAVIAAEELDDIKPPAAILTAGGIRAGELAHRRRIPEFFADFRRATARLLRR